MFIKTECVLHAMLASLHINTKWTCRKIPKMSPGAYIFHRPFLRGLFWRGLSREGNLCFKIDWASLIFGSKFTVLALFYFVFEGIFPSTSPPGAYIWRGDLTEGFFALRVWGAYIWRGLYMEGLFLEFYGILKTPSLESASIFTTGIVWFYRTLERTKTG